MEGALAGPNIFLQFYRPFAVDNPHLMMSGYSSGPTSSYDLHSTAVDNSNHDLLTQQHAHQHQHQNQQQHPHHGVSHSQPYQFDPHHQAEQQAYAIQANGHGEELQQLTPGAAEKQRWKGNRLRKACDSCSIRKVRCDESGPPCLACSTLDIPCTFERPSRRRGPPNRHAEALKRHRVDSPLATGGFPSPASPNNVAETLASFSSHAVLSAESICPFPVLELLVDDYFTYIHPLVPFPHEPSFRAAFKHREDLNNPSFLALLAAMVGALVASFPRRPRLHLKNRNQESLFPNSISLVERCHKVAVEARGPGYLDKDLTVYDAATSYLLALVGSYTYNTKQSRLYFGETLSILRVIGINKGDIPEYITGLGPEGAVQIEEPIDFIRQEIGRRIFWILFVGIRSSQQLGAVFEIIIPPPTPSEPYPPLPLEVDDQYIYVSRVDPQPADVVSELTGFNLNIQVYTTCTPLNTMELAYGIDEIFDWNRQKRVLENCLEAVKHALDGAPRELTLKPSPRPGELEGETSVAYVQTQQYFPDSSDGLGIAAGHHDGTFQMSRRPIQYEIQKANIYVSQLGTRSYLVEKYWNLLDAYESKVRSRDNSATSPGTHTSPGVMASGLDAVIRGMDSAGGYEMVESHMSTEREIIVKDLLRVLGSISQVNMEPNGGSIIYKIRQIASTLLDTPRNRKGPLAIKAEEYLARFLVILTKLENVSHPGAQEDAQRNAFEGPELQSDEEELRNWADFKECQIRFAANGGVLTDF